MCLQIFIHAFLHFWTPSGIFLPGTELLQSPFRTEFSMGSCSRWYRRSLRRRRPFLRSYCRSLLRRSGKSTHISMISNSVTHLRSYNNTAIADIAENSAPISPVTPRDRRCLRIECQYRRIEWRVFHDVSQCFKSVSWCFTSGSWCFTSGSWCFTSGSRCITMVYMFHDVLLCLTMFYND